MLWRSCGGVVVEMFCIGDVERCRGGVEQFCCGGLVEEVEGVVKEV